MINNKHISKYIASAFVFAVALGFNAQAVQYMNSKNILELASSHAACNTPPYGD